MGFTEYFKYLLGYQSNTRSGVELIKVYDRRVQAVPRQAARSR